MRLDPLSDFPVHELAIDERLLGRIVLVQVDERQTFHAVGDRLRLQQPVPCDVLEFLKRFVRPALVYCKEKDSE